MFGKGVQKIVQTVAREAKPVFRFNQGFEQMGAQVRPKDTRTTEEIKATIDALLKGNRDLKGFKKEINSMEPEHLGLVADVLEISRRHEMFPTAIDMNRINSQTGKSFIQALLEALPEASKENKGVLEFTQEVINNSDTITSKYFLVNLLDVIKVPELGEKFKRAKLMVKDIAEQTLNKGYTMDYTPQQRFMEFIQTLVNKNSQVDKLEILPEFCKVVGELPNKHIIYFDKFVNSSTPISQIKDNMSVLKNVCDLAEQQGKNVDVVDFVTHNVVNLK